MNFGLSTPVIARRTGYKTYSDGFVCGKAMTTEVNPQYSEASVYGDNMLARNAKKLKYADVSMGTTTLPAKAAVVMFGHTVDEENGEELRSSKDKENEVGYGFFTNEEIDGVDKCVACILYRLTFNEGSNSYETQGENLAFKTPTVSGKAMPEENGDWMMRKVCDTEEEAIAWIKQQLGVAEQAAKPVASVKGGTYAEAQSVVLTASDNGTIYYTTDGTTPSKTNGTKATSTAIAISKRTMLKAVNTATGKADSAVMAEEYIITG